MSLSKKNLDKLNTFIKNNNLVNENNNSSKKLQKSDNSSEIEDPSKIFYSIIDNSKNINETSESNQLLKKIENTSHNINSRENNYSKNLTIEEQLYDEFNYLLDQ